MPSSLTHPETLAEQFGDWLDDPVHGLSRHEVSAETNIAELVTIWMQDGGADRVATYDAFLRFVVLVIAEVAVGRLTVRVEGQDELLRPSIPTSSAEWWMLEPMEFEAARSRTSAQ